MLQPYSSEANVNSYVNLVRAAERQEAGRTAYLTRGQKRQNLTNQRIAPTARQKNPVAARRGDELRDRPRLSLYDFANQLGTYRSIVSGKG